MRNVATARARWLTAASAAVFLFLTACAPPPALGRSLITSNGITWDGDTLWVCDLLGHQLVKIDPITGDVLRRVNKADGLAPPDDVVVLDDGSLVYTSPDTGIVGRVDPDDNVTVVAQLRPGVNPIALTPDETAVVVSSAFSDTTELTRIDLATGQVTTIATDLPPLNGFSFGPDGALWAPSRGLGGLIGRTGGLIRIDISTGEWTERAVKVGGPNGPGLTFAVSAKWSPSGRLFMLDGGTGAILEIDPTTNIATQRATAGRFADNGAWSSDNVYAVTNFIGEVGTLDADGRYRRVPVSG